MSRKNIKGLTLALLIKFFIVPLNPTKSLTLLLSLAALFANSIAYSDTKGWIPLFNGHSLEGWTPNFDDQKVEVENGVIQMLSVKKNLWLVHDQSFKDFELTAEIKAPLGEYNTGIAFRCDATPIGYQCEIFDDQTGSLYAIKKGWVNPSSKETLPEFYKVAGDCYKKGEWNRYRIICKGDRIRIWVNGHKTTDIRDSKFIEGRVAIQHHGKGSTHYFRNIKIRALSD